MENGMQLSLDPLSVHHAPSQNEKLQKVQIVYAALLGLVMLS